MNSWSKLSLFVSVATILSLSRSIEAAAIDRHADVASSRHFSRAPSNPNKSVIIEMFEWNWDSIAQECTDFIGPAGYGFVQGEQTTRFALY